MGLDTERREHDHGREIMKNNISSPKLRVTFHRSPFVLGGTVYLLWLGVTGTISPLRAAIALLLHTLIQFIIYDWLDYTTEYEAWRRDYMRK